MGLFEGQPARYSLEQCRETMRLVRYFSEHQHPRARDGTFMARDQGRDRGITPKETLGQQGKHTQLHPKEFQLEGSRETIEPKQTPGQQGKHTQLNPKEFQIEGSRDTIQPKQTPGEQGKHTQLHPSQFVLEGSRDTLQPKQTPGEQGKQTQLHPSQFVLPGSRDTIQPKAGGQGKQTQLSPEQPKETIGGGQKTQMEPGKPKGGPEAKIFDAPAGQPAPSAKPKGGPEAKIFDPGAQTQIGGKAQTQVDPSAQAPAMSKPPKPGFQERRAKLQERAKKKEAEFEGMSDEERTAHKAERDAKAMVHNARKAKKPAGFIQQLMSHWLGTKNALGAAKKAAKAKKAASATTTQPATPQASPEASGDANPFAGFHEENIADRIMDIREGRHLRHQADVEPTRYAAAECRIRLAMSRRRLLPAAARG